MQTIQFQHNAVGPYRPISRRQCDENIPPDQVETTDNMKLIKTRATRDFLLRGGWR